MHAVRWEPNRLSLPPNPAWAPTAVSSRPIPDSGDHGQNTACLFPHVNSSPHPADKDIHFSSSRLVRLCHKRSVRCPSCRRLPSPRGYLLLCAQLFRRASTCTQAVPFYCLLQAIAARRTKKERTLDPPAAISIVWHFLPTQRGGPTDGQRRRQVDGRCNPAPSGSRPTDRCGANAAGQRPRLPGARQAAAEPPGPSWDLWAARSAAAPGRSGGAVKGHLSRWTSPRRRIATRPTEPRDAAAERGR